MTWQRVALIVAGLLALGGAAWGGGALAAPAGPAAFPAGTEPYGVALDPPTGRIFVVTQTGAALWTLDAKGAVLAQAPLPPGSTHVYLNSQRQRLYVLDDRTPQVLVLDAQNLNILARLPVPGGPLHGAVNPADDRFYVISHRANLLMALDADGQVLGKAPTDGGPIIIAVNPAANRIYVANDYSHNLNIFDGATLQVAARVSGLQEPHGLAVDSVGNRLFVAKNTVDEVAVIDLARNEVVATTVLGAGTHHHAGLDPVSGLVYVSNTSDNSVSVLDGATGKLRETIRVGEGPEDLAVDPVNRRVVVGNRYSGTVSVLPLPQAGDSGGRYAAAGLATLGLAALAGGLLWRRRAAPAVGPDRAS